MNSRLRAGILPNSARHCLMPNVSLAAWELLFYRIAAKFDALPMRRYYAQFLADKIAVLGGEPTTRPRPVPHAEEPRAMLQEELNAEKQAIADCAQRIEQAEAFGDVGLKVDLENQIADETRHKEEMERILAGWHQR